MTINLKIPEVAELKPRITVFGVGGAGGNAVNNMIESKLEGVEFVVANTDAQALSQSAAERCIQMGAALTEGLGAGSDPQIGSAAAEEAMSEISDHLANSHMAFITAGMGGGTGTGAAPVIARASREKGILTIGVVTKPFQFEGQRRMAIADKGIEELSQYVDTLIVIPNQNLFRIANEKTTFADAFAMADQVLHSGVAGITDLMVKEGLINLDFADVRAIMAGMGKAMMGTGEASGETRAIDAAEAAISNPLLDDVTMKGARGLLISITGGSDLTLYEVDEAATRIREEVDAEANIILGATYDENLEGVIRVSVVSAGIEGVKMPTAQKHDATDLDEFVAVVDMSKHDLTAKDDPLDESESWFEERDNLKQAEEDELMRALNEDRPQKDQSEAEYVERALPRMPDIDDFPPQAKAEMKNQADLAEKGKAKDVAEKRRAGFFERLSNVGLGRKTAAADIEQPMEPSFEPKPAEIEAAFVRKNADKSSKDKAFIEPEKADENTGVKDFEEENLEIPAFLRRQAN